MLKISTKIDPEFLVFFKSLDRLALVFGNNIHIYSTENGSLLRILFNQSGRIKSISENGANLLAVDSQGSLSLWNSESLEMITSKSLGNEVISAVISPNFENLFYSRPKDNNILKVSILDLNDSWEYNEEIIQRPKHVNQRNYRMKISANNQYLLEYGEKNVYIYYSQRNVFLKKIRHLCDISCLEISPKNDNIIVGDKLGKVSFYYNAFQAEDRTALSSVHWHSHQVNSLFMTPDATQLLSTGEEGVVVFWHLIANKKTFCPRLGGAILNVNTDPTTTVFAALLDSNSVKLVKTSNFEEIATISLITNPAQQHKESQSLENIIRKSLKIHPKSNQICLPSTPGQIQFFDVDSLKKVKDLEIVPRNQVSRSQEEYPVPTTVDLISFDKEGKWMVTVEQRRATTDSFEICNLKFWEERGFNQYELNSRVDFPHSNSQLKYLGYIHFSDDKNYFVTVCENGSIKIWFKKLKTVSKDEKDKSKIIWALYDELNYRNVSVNKVSGYKAQNGANYLIFNTQNHINVWDVESFKTIYSYDVGQGEEVLTFEICGNKIFAATTKKLTVFDVEKKKIQFEANCDNIFDLFFEQITHSVYLLVRRDQSTTIIIFDSTNYSLKRAIVFQDTIVKILPLRSDLQTKLVAFSSDLSLFMLDETLKEITKENFMYTSVQEKVEEDPRILQKRNTEMINQSQKSLIKKSENKLKFGSNYFTEKTHLIPPSTLIYKPLIDRYLHKIHNLEIDQSLEIPELNFEVKQISNEERDKNKDMSSLIKEFDKRIEKEFNFS